MAEASSLASANPQWVRDPFAAPGMAYSFKGLPSSKGL
jgi:hypothetical protein